MIGMSLLTNIGSLLNVFAKLRKAISFDIIIPVFLKMDNISMIPITEEQHIIHMLVQDG